MCNYTIICHYVKLPFYRVTGNSSCLEDVTVDAGFVCDKATVLGDNIKGTLCNVFYQLQINAYQVKRQ